MLSKFIKSLIPFVIIVCFTAIKGYAYDWPFEEGGSQTVEQKIRQTVGAARGDDPPTRFHNGIDICPNDTLNKTVLVVNEAAGDTIAHWIGSGTNIGIRIGDLRYIHINNRITDTIGVHKGDSLGTIFYVYGTTHIHFKHGGLSPNIYNPLGGDIVDSLTPYTDTIRPFIDPDSISFCDQTSGAQMYTDSLRGKIDIDVKISDWTNNGVNGPQDHLGRICPYKIGFQIVDTLGNIEYDTCKIKFDRVPPNTNVHWILRRLSNTHPVFRITNVALNGDTVEDHYWNTKQKNEQPDSVDADSIEEARFKDGKYWVKVLAYDIRENADSESIYVQVGNFVPKVKETDPYDGETDVPLNQHIYIRFSEPMDSGVDLWSAISIFPGVSGDREWLSSTEIGFSPDPSFVENATYTVSLSSQLKDLQGQELIPYNFSFTTGDSPGPQGYPTRFQWEDVTWWDVSVSWFDNYYTFQIFWDFLFPFYESSYNMIIFNRRGSIWFDTNRDWCHFDLPTAGGSGQPVMAVYNDSLRHLFGHYSRGRSRELSNPNREVVRWTYTYYADTTEFEAVLFNDGTIRFDYRKCDIDTFFDNDGGSGISKGDGINYSIIPGPVYELAPASFIFTTNPPPGYPRDLDTTTAEREDSISLIWRANPEPDLEGYCIYRSDTAYQYGMTPYDTVWVPETTFTDTSPMNGTNYYVVTAFDDATYESRYSNQVEVFVDAIPPSSPYIAEAEKSSNDVVLTWNKITTDTLGNSETMYYYVVYRNTSPAFIPASSDSIGYASHPDTVYTDTDALDSTDSYYYLVKAVDWARNQSKKSNMGYKFNKLLNENAGATSDRNWVGLPYHSEYDSIKDATDDLSPSGTPISKITMLEDTLQAYYSWIYHPVLGWYGNHPTTADFPILPGCGYEFIAERDATWNPTEYSNKTGMILLAGHRSRKSDLEVYLGKSLESDRAPVWLVKEDIDCNPATLKSKPESKKKIDYLDADVYKPLSLKKRKNYHEEKRKISHTVHVNLVLEKFENLLFTAYRPKYPDDVLTEKMVGSAIIRSDKYHLVSFDVGNFKRYWKDKEEVILIVEAAKKGKGYFAVMNFKLDEGVDIQKLGMISLEPIPEPNVKTTLSSVRWKEIKNENIVGYSLYKNGKRLNQKVLTRSDYSTEGNVIVKPVIKGGYETVYSSNITTTEERALIPLQFSFGSISPNPFTKCTEIKYALPSQVKVNIVIFDIIGRKVRTLVSERQEPGYYSTVWNGTDDKGRKVSSGIYFIRFEAGEFRSQNKILLVK